MLLSFFFYFLASLDATTPKQGGHDYFGLEWYLKPKNLLLLFFFFFLHSSNWAKILRQAVDYRFCHRRHPGFYEHFFVRSEESTSTPSAILQKRARDELCFICGLMIHVGNCASGCPSAGDRTREARVQTMW